MIRKMFNFILAPSEIDKLYFESQRYIVNSINEDFSKNIPLWNEYVRKIKEKQLNNDIFNQFKNHYDNVMNSSFEKDQ